uniref:Uncharacterized protein n=1 Tax=Anguilla anguilla TaxID=7936 RepID=A0A0E9QUL4_ANGAN
MHRPCKLAQQHHFKIAKLLKSLLQMCRDGQGSCRQWGKICS